MLIPQALGDGMCEEGLVLTGDELYACFCLSSMSGWGVKAMKQGKFGVAAKRQEGVTHPVTIEA